MQITGVVKLAWSRDVTSIALGVDSVTYGCVM